MNSLKQQEIIQIRENGVESFQPSILENSFKPSFPTNLKFQSLQIGRLNTQSLSPSAIAMQRNPFNTINPGIIPGPMSLRCDNVEFMQSWIKYIFQSAICVICHALTFLLTILWIRFIFNSYYNYQYNHSQETKNDISSHTVSILSYLSSSSWIWILISLTNIIFFLGFMISTWIIPIQWNFEDNSNTKLFRYFGITFILIVIISNIAFNILQIFTFSIFYDVSIISQLSTVTIFSFILLFVIIKNGRNSDSLTNNNHEDVIQIDVSSEPSSSPLKKDIEDNIEQNIERRHILQKIQTKATNNIIKALTNDYSCSKLVIICAVFSFIVTATIASLYINFNYVLSFILNNNKKNDKILFGRIFMTHLIVTIFGTLLVGDLLICLMRILMRYLTILLSDSYDGNHRLSFSNSFNINYSSMQSFNRMILFIIPQIFINKLSAFFILYTFVDPFEFTVAIITCCIFSRCFTKIFTMFEDKMIERLFHDEDDSDYFDEESLMTNIQDNHLLAQCNYIHDIIQYISTLLIPLIFGSFRINLQNNQSSPQLYYLQTLFIQFIIQSLFDIFPLFIILIGNPVASSSQTGASHSFYHLTHNSPNLRQKTNVQSRNKCCSISAMAMDLKIEYINMMNGWTATDKCVRHFMWWSTIFIGGYFTFYVLYPQQFLCAMKAESDNIIFGNWLYIECE